MDNMKNVLKNRDGITENEAINEVNYGYYEAPKGTKILFDMGDVLTIKEIQVEEENVLQEA